MHEAKLFFKYLVAHANEVILIFTALCGFILQYSVSKDKGFRPAIIMFLSTIVTASLLHLLMSHFGFKVGDAVHTAVLVMSTLISVAFISLIIAVASMVAKIAPDAIIGRLADEIENRNNPNKKQRNNRRRSRRIENYEQDYEGDEIDPYE